MQNQTAMNSAGFPSTPWAMQAEALDQLSASGMLAKLSSPEAAGDFSAGPNSAIEVKGGVATIRVEGVLLRQVPRWMAWWGMAATGYVDIQAKLQAAVEDPKVERIELFFKSPGGSISGLSEAAESVRIARAAKPVDARVEDLCASAAFWIASQCETIHASANAFIGSIGVRTVIQDLSGMAEQMGIKVHAITSGKHKGTGIPGTEVTAEQLAPIQEMVNQIADRFLSAVKEGRGERLVESEDIATGRDWLAEQAVELGLIDGVVKIENAPSKGSAKTRKKTMADKEETTVDLDAVKKNAAAEALSAERTRTKELCAAFPKDAEFAMAQSQAGATVTEAKGAYSEVLNQRLTEAQAEVSELKELLAKSEAKNETNTPEASGSDAVPTGESENGGGDFMATAQARKKEDKISLTQAMKLTARENPDLHKQYVQNCRK